MPPEGALASFSPYVAWGFSPMRTWICRNIIFFIVNLLTGLFPAWYLVYNLITNTNFSTYFLGMRPFRYVEKFRFVKKIDTLKKFRFVNKYRFVEIFQFIEKYRFVKKYRFVEIFRPHVAKATRYIWGKGR
jgi:hypothetical protein